MNTGSWLCFVSAALDVIAAVLWAICSLVSDDLLSRLVYAGACLSFLACAAVTAYTGRLARGDDA